MENKREGNENEKILGEFNKIIPEEFACTMNKMDRDCRNKTQRIYKCGSNYALSKLIVDNGLQDLWRRKNPDSSEFTHYDRSSGTRSRTDRVYNHVKDADSNKINHIIVSFADNYNGISLGKLPSKTKLGKD